MKRKKYLTEIDQFVYVLEGMARNRKFVRKTNGEKLEIILQNISDSKTELGAITSQLSYWYVDYAFFMRGTIDKIFKKEWFEYEKHIRAAIIKKKSLVEQFDYAFVDISRTSFYKKSSEEKLNIILCNISDPRTVVGEIVHKANKLDLNAIIDIVPDIALSVFNRYDSKIYSRIIIAALFAEKDPIRKYIKRLVEENIEKNKVSDLIYKIQIGNIKVEDILKEDDRNTMLVVDLKAIAKEARVIQEKKSVETGWGKADYDIGKERFSFLQSYPC
jgi:hypothetical protein